ncbi:hypothetical protein D3C76_1783100 [compost metagenome]
MPRPDDMTPFHVEPLEGTLSVKAPAGLKLYGRTADGQEQVLASSYQEGRYIIRFDGRSMTNWLFLK